MVLPNRALLTIASLSLAAAIGCAGASTAPSPGTAASQSTDVTHGSATVAGVLALRTPGSASGSADLAAANVGGAWTVGIADTVIRAAVDSTGRFELRGVPAGDHQLVFTNGTTTAALALPGVTTGAVIQIDVIIENGVAAMRNEARASEKIVLCHRTGSGNYHSIEVDRHAEPAHRDHGDAAVGDRIPDDRTKVFDAACRPAPFGVTVETSTNGEKADLAPGPSIAIGSPIVWRYVVVNLSEGPLTNVVVTDNRGVTVDCGGATVVGTGGAMTCVAIGVAVAGQYENIGRVTADSIDGPVEDTDPSHYLGVVPPVPPGGAPPEDDGHKVALCHLTTGNSYHLIQVAAAAEPAHRAHGDARPGEAIPGRPGDTFTESCSAR
jgi:hypothetical protein